MFLVFIFENFVPSIFSKILRPKVTWTKNVWSLLNDTSIESPWRAESKNIFTKNSGQLLPVTGVWILGSGTTPGNGAFWGPKAPKKLRRNPTPQCRTHLTVKPVRFWSRRPPKRRGGSYHRSAAPIWHQTSMHKSKPRISLKPQAFNAQKNFWTLPPAHVITKVFITLT